MQLSGHAELRCTDVAWQAGRGHGFTWTDGPLRITGHGTGAVLLLAGPMSAWRTALAQRAGLVDALLPADGRCPRHVLGTLACLARRSLSGDALATLLATLCEDLIAVQAPLQARLPLCTGRTPARRRQTLRRLLRVQHAVRYDARGRVDLARLAATASYSPCHLIRVYREVFGETPSEYAARLRLQRAWRMVRETAMPVCEISEALGFESQSAFCRAFKSSFGSTTTQVRAGAWIGSRGQGLGARG